MLDTLDTGLITSLLHCTSRGVAIYRALRLNCPQYLEGKMHKPHYDDSTTQPAEGVEEELQLDLEQRPVPAASGRATEEMHRTSDRQDWLFDPSHDI
jgi:hypothetical protein